MLKKYFSFIKVSTIQQWKAHVLDSQVPVLVHFHTDWSEDSIKLKSYLNSEHNFEQFNIIEVDADELKSISKILNIRVVPTVYMIHKSRTVQSFEGQITEKERKKLIYDIRLLSGFWTEKDFLVHLMNDAVDLYEAKKYDESIAMYSRCMQIESMKELFEPTLIVGLIRCHFARGDFESTEFYINQMHIKHSSSLAKVQEVKKEIDKIFEVIGNKRQDSKYYEYKAAVDKANADIQLDPYNDDNHIALAAVHYDYGFIEEALSKSLQIIESEGTLTGKGYKLLMEIINDLGHDNIYVQNFQPKLDFIHKKFRISRR